MNDLTAKVLLCLMPLVLVGCDQPQDYAKANDMIIAETKKCEANGLDASVIYEGWNMNVVGVLCYPRAH